MLKKEWKLIVSIFITSLSLYVFTINRCCSIVLDSICYISDIAKNNLVFHPHHLIYHAVFYYWSKFLQLFGITDLVFAIPTVNALFASISLVIIYLLFRVRFELSKSISLLFLSLPAFSYGFWMVSTSVNVYAASLTFILLCFFLYLDKSESRRKWFLIGVFHSLAIIFNEWNIFTFLVITLGIFLSANRKAIFRKYYFYYFIPMSFITAGTYLSVMIGYYRISTFSGIYKWMTYYSSVFEWSSFGMTTLKQALMGIGQTISAPYWLIKSSIFEFIFHKSLQHFSIEEELYFCRGIGSFEATIYLILLIIIVIVLFYFIFRIFRDFNKTNSSDKKAVVYLSLWIIISSIMPFFWYGAVSKYWYTQTVAFFMLAALNSKNIHKHKAAQYYWITGILAIALFTINFFGVIIPAKNQANDLIYKRVEPITKTATKGDVIIYKNTWSFGFYISTYIPNAKQLNLSFLTDSITLLKVKNELDNLENTLKTNDVYILQDVFKETNDYPQEIQLLLAHTRLKYKPYIQKYQNHFICYYKLSKKNEN